MSLYFVFSDEYGSYFKDKTKNSLSAHPFYIRSALIILAEEWKILHNSFIELKKRYNLPIDKEIKWSYLWSLRKYKIDNKLISNKSEFKFLENHDYHLIIDFIDESLSIINKLKYKNILFSITVNSKVGKIDHCNILRMHMQCHMQRIQMELQKEIDNLAVIFIDQINNNSDNQIKDDYNKLFFTGDFIKNYTNIKDSVNIEFSHQSTGIQLADYIAGAFGSYLKSFIDADKYTKGHDMFLKHIYPNIRSDKNGDIFGFGLYEVPTNNSLRNDFKKKYFKK